MRRDRDSDEIKAIEAYLGAPKFVKGGFKWRSKGHKDYSQIRLPVVCHELPEIDGQVILTAHISRSPRKYSFTLLVGSDRITGLDVNPGASHLNVTTLESVSVTHWQWFPLEEAEPDDRDLTHFEWLTEFGEKTRIELEINYKAPPYQPVQLDLL